MSTLRVSNIEAKADPSSPSVDEKLKVTNSNGDILVHIDGKTAGVTTIGINTTDRSFTVDAAQNVEFLGIVTATKFSLSGGGEITGGDGNFTGVVTATSISATDSTIGVATITSLTAASANFTGNVSIAGTLTYEDVTNVDSIGIATARTGIDVTGGHVDLIDDSRIRVGTGTDLQIYHNGSNSYIDDSGTGALFVRGSYLAFAGINGEQLINAEQNAAVELFHNGTKKLETTTTGAKVTGALEVTQEYPSIRPTLDLNFAATKTLDRRITFTRDGVGTYVDDMGIIKYSSNNTPRFDHDPVTGESLGLLIEEARTNQMIYSSDITGDTAQNGTITGDATTAPDGTTTADQYAANSTNSIHRIDHAFTSGQILNSTVYTFSVFVKANGYDKLHIRYAGYNADNHGRGYDLSDGTTFDGKFDGTGSLGAVTSSSMIAYPNGWYRCIFTVTTAADATSGTSQILYYVSNSESTTNFAGDGSSGMYFWGAQMEAGSFPTSYIPTSGSTVTRAQDSAKITGTNLTDFYNQPEGTIFADYKVIQSDPDIFYLSNGQSSRRIGLYEAGSSQTRFIIGNSGTVADTTDSAGTTVGDNIKSAGAYKLNDIVAAKNGVISSTDNSATIPDGIDRAYIGGYYEGTAEGVLGLRRLSYYNKRLPNAQLQGLTQQ